MNILKIQGGNFIGHKKSPFEINFIPGTNIITGPNGFGKTLLLQLMYSTLCSGKYPWDLVGGCYYIDEKSDTKIDWFRIFLSDGSVIEVKKDRVVKGWKPGISISMVPEYISYINLENLCPIDYKKMLVSPGVTRERLFTDRFIELMNTEVLSYKTLEYSEETGLTLKPENGGLKTPLLQMSRGEARVFELLYSAMTTRGILLIDNPEVAVHIALQDNLVEWMREVAIDPELQIIFATHSPILLASVGKDDWIDLYNIFSN